ncbi:UNVERIFIED_CONTAM: hypothetical protein GTU68_066520 [Idotea baltica]|nr:hypothetical protein [Idotea baltica]
MVIDAKKKRTPLLPDRYPIDDFFICDVTDAIPKDDMGSMEHPIFSLSTKPDTRIKKYEHNGVQITIAPSAYGLATIHDKDILIYCISQLIAKMNAGGNPQKTLHLKAFDLLVATNRKAEGRGYEQLRAAFERLSGTRITTNLKTGEEEVTEGFGLIDSWRIIRSSDSGRMQEIKVNLSDWVFNAILSKEVLTLHRNYFRLRKPLERRMYELARKHCGQQEFWKISLELLKKKCGSVSTDKEFKRLVQTICKENQIHDHFPDYLPSLEDNTIIFQNRDCQKEKISADDFPRLNPDTYHDARLAAPKYDVYWLENEWQQWWVESGKPELHSPDKAFIGFCKRKWEQNPNP